MKKGVPSVTVGFKWTNAGLFQSMSGLNRDSFLVHLNQCMDLTRFEPSMGSTHLIAILYSEGPLEVERPFIVTAHSALAPPHLMIACQGLKQCCRSLKEIQLWLVLGIFILCFTLQGMVEDSVVSGLRRLLLNIMFRYETTLNTLSTVVKINWYVPQCKAHLSVNTHTCAVICVVRSHVTADCGH